MKKTLALILAMVMVFALCSCTASLDSETAAKLDDISASLDRIDAALSSENESTAVEETDGSDLSSSAAWYSDLGEPEYGGDIVFASNRFNDALDIWNSDYSSNYYFLEPLFIPNWEVDRDEFAFKTNFIPKEYYTGCLAVDYEVVDLQTIIVYLRDGVYWQDKEPVNGRQFVASDVAYHYNRLAGLDTFADDGPSPVCGTRLSNLESVTALDDLTVEFKFKEASASNETLLLDQDSFNYIMAPEVIDAGVGADWEYAVGTGPWVLTEYDAGNRIKFVRNENYWGYDERYPENQLPYADTLTVLHIEDESTLIASLRSGEVDFADELTLQKYETLMSSDNDLESYCVPLVATNGLSLNINFEPFSDINVRKAMQMSIDRETIAAQYFGGIDGTPAGWINPNNSEYAYNYEEWSDELKEEYGYNPERAKELLTEAGYPDGFSFTAIVASNEDVTVMEILKSYWAAIGIDMTIDAKDAATVQALGLSKEFEAMWGKNTASGALPSNMVRMDYSTANSNYTCANDPVYDEMCDELVAATSDDEIKELCTKLDEYVLEQHWGIRLFPTYIYNVKSPSIGGYSGENLLRMGSPGGWFWARIWKA